MKATGAILREGILPFTTIPDASTEVTIGEAQNKLRLLAEAGGKAQAFEGPWSFPTVANLSQLVTLTLTCPLPTLPALPESLRILTLSSCRIGEGTTPLKITELNQVTTFTINRCSGRFEFGPLGAKSALKRFDVLYSSLDVGGVTDQYFVAFPKTLVTFVIEGAKIADDTVDKLPGDLGEISLTGCKGVTSTKARLRVKFGYSCIIKGDVAVANSATAHILKAMQEAVLEQDGAVELAYDHISPFLGNEKNTLQQPTATLFFAGPSGVGKTELAKTIAKVTNRNFERFNMEGYSQENQVSTLIGPPLGHEGAAQGGLLTNAVLKNPRSVILLDEFEKAHKKILQGLLGCLETGEMVDGKGTKVDFTQSIIIMTSNLGDSKICDLNWINTDKAMSDATEIVKRLLADTPSAAFASRIDQVIAFRPIEKDLLKSILKAKAPKIIADALANYNVTLTISDSVFAKLVNSADKATGVRPPYKELQKAVTTTLSQGKQAKAFKEGEKVELQLNQQDKYVLKLK